MRITTLTDYGLICVLNLARRYKTTPIKIEDISKEEKLPLDYLEQLLNRLKNAKIVKGIRGPGGGYILAKDPKKISIKDVIEAVEGNVFNIICYRLKNKQVCIHKSGCGINPIWIELKNKIEQFLSSINLGMLLK